MTSKPNPTPHIDPASTQAERERLENMNLRAGALDRALREGGSADWSAADVVARAKVYEAYIRGDAAQKTN